MKRGRSQRLSEIFHLMMRKRIRVQRVASEVMDGVDLVNEVDLVESSRR